MGLQARARDRFREEGQGIDVTNPVVQAAMASATQAIEQGMKPQQLAEIVFEGIREERFYLLPNAEPFMPAVKERMDGILNGRNPRPAQ